MFLFYHCVLLIIRDMENIRKINKNDKLFWLMLMMAVTVTHVEAQVQASPPCFFIFGDSLSDSGNNNPLATVAKFNYLPYGVDFPSGPTGRPTNGRTVPDFLCTLQTSIYSSLFMYYCIHHFLNY